MAVRYTWTASVRICLILDPPRVHPTWIHPCAFLFNTESIRMRVRFQRFNGYNMRFMKRRNICRYRKQCVRIKMQDHARSYPAQLYGVTTAYIHVHVHRSFLKRSCHMHIDYYNANVCSILTLYFMDVPKHTDQVQNRAFQTTKKPTVLIEIQQEDDDMRPKSW